MSKFLVDKICILVRHTHSRVLYENRLKAAILLADIADDGLSKVGFSTTNITIYESTVSSI